MDAVKNVNDVYTSIASDFDKTRFSQWIGVRLFLDTLHVNSLLGDIGCGNGKYLSYRKDINVHGTDICEPLIIIAKNKNESANIIRANALMLPYRDKSFDNTISIAVLHHFTTIDERVKFLKELARITVGNIMISVWATEQTDARKSKWRPIGNGNNDYIIPYMTTNRKETYDRYYHLFEKEEIINLCKNILTIQKIWYEKNNWYFICTAALTSTK